MTDQEQVELATTWLLAARGMVAARDEAPREGDATGGLYAQAILGVSEDACLGAKEPDRIGVLTLVDCIARVQALPRDVSEKIVTGAMMIALADGVMRPLEVRWASMLASAAGLGSEEFQRCCASARVIAAMVRPRTEAPV